MIEALQSGPPKGGLFCAWQKAPAALKVSLRSTRKKSERGKRSGEPDPSCPGTGLYGCSARHLSAFCQTTSVQGTPQGQAVSIGPLREPVSGRGRSAKQTAHAVRRSTHDNNSKPRQIRKFEDQPIQIVKRKGENHDDERRVL